MSHWFKMEFKFGDYVKVLRKAEIEDYSNMPCAWNDESMDRTIGKTGRIANIEDGCVEVEFTDKFDSWWYPTTVLEKVERKSTKEYPEHHSKLGFFVGDRVKIKDHPDNFPEFFEEYLTWGNCWLFDMNNYIGKEGIITNDYGKAGLEVDFDDGKVKFNFPYFCLEKIIKKIRKKNTGIVIKTEKIVDQGRQMYKVIRIKALNYNQLPSIYFTKGPYCYKRDNELCIFNKVAMGVVEGCQYSKTDMDDFIEIVKKCGDRLMKINQELKEANKDWHGEEIFTI